MGEELIGGRSDIAKVSPNYPPGQAGKALNKTSINMENGSHSYCILFFHHVTLWVYKYTLSQPLVNTKIVK